MNKIVFGAKTTKLEFERLSIARKQFDRMCDLMAVWTIEPADHQREIDLIDYQDSIGWPWKATQEQITTWNARFIAWSSHFDKAIHLKP